MCIWAMATDGTHFHSHRFSLVACLQLARINLCKNEQNKSSERGIPILVLTTIQQNLPADASRLASKADTIICWISSSSSIVVNRSEAIGNTNYYYLISQSDFHLNAR